MLLWRGTGVCCSGAEVFPAQGGVAAVLHIPPLEWFHHRSSRRRAEGTGGNSIGKAEVTCSGGSDGFGAPTVPLMGDGETQLRHDGWKPEWGVGGLHGQMACYVGAV